MKKPNTCKSNHEARPMETLKTSAEQRLSKCSRMFYPAAVFAVALLAGHSVYAVSNTWSAAVDGTWDTAGNWAGGLNIPGATSGTSNAETATFNTATGITVAVDAYRNLQNITFDTLSGSFTLSGGHLYLTNSGTTQIGSGFLGTGKTETINSAITLVGKYTFANNSTDASNVLYFGTGATISGPSSPSLTLAGVNTGANTIAGVISGATSISKVGVGTWILSGANTFSGISYIAGGTLVLTGNNTGGNTFTVYNTLGGNSTLQLSGQGAWGYSSSKASLSTGGVLVVDNSTAAGGNKNNRFSSSQSFYVGGGSFLYKGADAAGVNSTEAIGALNSALGGMSTFTVAYGSTNTATLTVGSLSRGTGYSTILVNGTNLGKDGTSTSSVGRLLLSSTSGWTQVGATAATASGINSTVQNTKIIPFLVGEATSTSGGLGTATGIANTFVTYEATTGLRPLNPTDEFTNNAFTSGNNIYITANTAANASASINSLVIKGGDVTIADAQNLTNTSGALLFASSNSIKSASPTGILTLGANGSTEGIITVNDGVNAVISAVIAGPSGGGFTKSGSGRLTLSGANLISGTTGLAGGTLSIGNDSALGTSTLLFTNPSATIEAVDGARTINNGVSFAPTNVYNQIGYGGIISGTNALTINGLVQNSTGKGYVLTLTVNNTAITTLAGGLALSNGESSGTILTTINGSGNVVISGAITAPYSGSTTGALTYAGSGVLTLSGTNTYGFATNISSGIVNLQSSSALSANSAVSVASGATLQMQGNIACNSTAGITIRGTGASGATGVVENISGNNSYTGLLTLSGAAVTIASDSGMLSLSGTITGSQALTLTGDGDGKIASIIGIGASQLTKSGTGTWTLSGANTYTGTTNVSAGTLKFGKKTSLYGGTIGSWKASNIKVSSGATLALSVGGDSEFSASDVSTLLGMGGSATTGFQAGSNIGFDTTNAASGNFEYVNAIADSYANSKLGLIKLGDNILTLSAANTYTGATTVSSGELDINGSLSASSAVSVASGATLGGSGNVQGSVNIASGTIKGSGLTVASGTFSGASTLAGSSTATSGYTIASGTTDVTGTTASSVNVASGLLKGTGKVGNVTVSGTIGGTLTAGTLSGAGLVSPGNSPGILTVASLASSNTLSFAFELTTATPTYTNSTASGNDVLHVTNSSTGLNLSSGNAISIYFSSLTNSGALGGSYEGTFYVEGLTGASLVAAFNTANVTYYVVDTDGNTTGDVTFSGTSYTTLSKDLVTVSYVDKPTSDFGTGTAASTLEFTVVPEPSTWVMLTGGMGLLALGQRLRRNSRLN